MSILRLLTLICNLISAVNSLCVPYMQVTTVDGTTGHARDSGLVSPSGAAEERTEQEVTRRRGRDSYEYVLHHAGARSDILRF